MSHDLSTPVPPAGQTPPAERGNRRAPKKKRRTGRIVLFSLLALVLVLGGTAYWLYSSLDSELKDNAVDLDKALGDDSSRPAKKAAAGDAMNLLVLGSDSRAGDNGDLAGGSVSGQRSDTTLLVHIAKGHTEAVAVSIPRDTLVTRPECTTKSGKVLPEAKRVMFNAVYALGGPGCTAKTVESMSDVRIDHLVELDFSGFKQIVDEVGGVTVTLDKPIDNDQLQLGTGTHRLDGDQSLQFVRTRHGYGDGSDLGRIELQQKFLKALIGEVQKQDLLTSPTKAYSIARSATGALTTDKELASLTALADFAQSVKGIDAEGMQTIMLPVTYDKVDPNRVVAVESKAEKLWTAIRDDTEIPAELLKDAKKTG
ncbi:LCP family protein [Streptomyces sp. NPDC018972]|uniref:LCP family protein n=1 Tax=Streptomyces sp. NPDC018972 TaxID=3365060 RepID=UPI0037AA0B06